MGLDFEFWSLDLGVWSLDCELFFGGVCICDCFGGRIFDLSFPERGQRGLDCFH